ncbi:MAG TPA: SprT family zinc-dependent metalloprotease [Castellaniella sp.]|nr:SprT family zinc-dependent metalloprotease [Castellaniella sp.]
MPVDQLDLFPAGEPADPVPRDPPRHTSPAPTQAPARTPLRPAVLPEGGRWHEVRLGPQTIGFVLRRTRRRSIGFVIRDDGLLVQAPSWATHAQIEQAVHSKADWILRKLDERWQRLQLLALQSTQWQAGGAIPYLGVRIELAIDGSRAVHYAGNADAPGPSDILSLPLPEDAAPDRVRDSASVWLQHRAQVDFGRRLQHFLSLAGVTLNQWRLSSATGRWGSCSSQGRILLNWRLIHFAPHLIDYVVAHEVAHLRVMNHSPQFWQVVARLYPDFKAARDTLSQYQPDSLPLL